MPVTRSAKAARRDTPTSAHILDVAERLSQTRGFNGFSYADIASELGLTKASLHYHFASKADLGQALIDRYTVTFVAALSAIEASESDARRRLERYVQLYADVLRNDRMCLCGMLAAEYTTLPDPMKRAIRQFFDENEAWLTRVLQGRGAGSVAVDGSARDAARVITAGLEGAMLLARSYGDSRRFAVAAEHLLREFVPGSRRTQPNRSASASGR